MSLLLVTTGLLLAPLMSYAVIAGIFSAMKHSLK